jgi:hypothetical protein
MRVRLLVATAALFARACSAQRVTPESAATAIDSHAGHEMPTSGPSLGIATGQGQGAAVAAGAADVAERLARSPRHAEWAKIPTAAGSADSIAA